MRIFTTLAGVAIAIAALIFIAGMAGMLRGQAPTDLGLRDGKLKPPSKTDNSVSSQADLYPDHPQRSYSQIAPLQYSGDGKAAMVRLAELLAGRPRTTIVVREPGYLRAECVTRLLQFTDDVEFALDPVASVIHVRSASRIGRKDFGVNRERVEQIRAAFKG
jgi:uncharacterized protein (DUF1499 family)